MEELLGRIETLENSLKRMIKFVMAHHVGETDSCDACRILQGKPVLINKKQVSRIFDAANMLDRADPPRKKTYIRNIFNLCQVGKFQDITTEQWPEVEKIVESIEQEMKELGIVLPKKVWNKQ